MKKRFFALGLTFVFIINLLPIAFAASAASEAAVNYTIWQADPNNVSAESGESVKANMDSGAYCKPKYDVIKMTDNGSYYRTEEMLVKGRGGDGYNTVLNSGINNNKRGYGWLEDTTVLQVLRPYMTVSFEYKVDCIVGSAPSDGLLYIKAAHAYSGNATALCAVPMAGASDWKRQSIKLSGNTFNTWYSGYLGLSIYSDSGKLNGKYAVNLRDFKISLSEADKLAINGALEAAGSLWRFNDIVQSDPNFSSHNSVWYASPELLGAENGQNVTATVLNSYLPAKYNTTAVYDADGSYYRTEMAISGTGGDQYNAVIKSGIDYKTEGFGWLENKDLLNALAPYMYISFEYRLTGTEAIPDDAYIYFGAATEYGKVCKFGAVNGASSEWKEYTLAPISEGFTLPWYSGFFTFNLYSWTGGFLGTQTVDLRNIRIELRDSDRTAINSALGRVSGITGINNFSLDAIRDRDENGNYNYYNLLIGCLPDTPFDANDDGKADILDLVRIKKHTAGIKWLSNVIIKRLDVNGDGKVSGLELADLKKTLLNEKRSPYADDPLKVALVTEHPGVAEMDAYYQLSVTDRNGTAVSANNVRVTASNAAVSVDGYNLTVPYSVRSADSTLTVTVTDRSNSTVFGRYDFNFVKYTDSPTLFDDFTSLNTDLWSVYNDAGAYGIENGNLKFTSQVGQTVGLTTKNKFEQAYGSFSARIKMPDKALVNGAFWLYSNTGKQYRRNPLNPSVSGGEIDIVEYFPTWTGGAKWSSTVHWNGATPGHHCSSGDDRLNAGVDLGNDYHIYSAVWMKDAIYSYLDGRLYRVYDGEGVSDHSDGMQIILSLHGCSADDSWGGKFNAKNYPDTMKTDWLKVYGLSE